MIAEKLTMNVKELLEKLSEYPDEMLVYGTWEGVCGRIQADCFQVEPIRTSNGPVLLIDVEDYF